MGPDEMVRGQSSSGFLDHGSDLGGYRCSYLRLVVMSKG
jgi:hypothetical protein